MIPTTSPLDTEPDIEPTDGGSRRLTRGRTLLVACAVLVMVDVGFGLAAERFSSQQRQADEIHEMGSEFSEAEGQTMLVVGGPAIVGKIDPALLEEGLAANGDQLTADMVTITATGTGTWAAVYDEHFVRTGATPDVLVIGFTGDQLNDQNRVDWATVGQVHTGWESLQARIESTPDLNSKLLVAGARVSNLLGNRRWLSDLLSDAIPGYQSLPRTEPSDPIEERTYTVLADMIADATGDGVKVAVVALPRRQNYDVAEQFPSVVSGAGGRFIDLRLSRVFTEDRFVDGAQLTSEGSAELSARMANRLSTLINTG